VDHTQYDTVSILSTIEDRFGLPALSSRDAADHSLGRAMRPGLPRLSGRPRHGQASPPARWRRRPSVRSWACPGRRRRLLARIAPIDPADADPLARHELELQLTAHGRVTNMKRTLAHSGTALHALMTWYPLRDRVAGFLGDRATTLFAHAISAKTDCLICSTFFRRILVEEGEDPDALELDDREQVVVDFAVQLARDANDVSDDLYGRLAAFLKPSEIVDLTAFGAMMIATNVVNNALRVDLDEYLLPYRSQEA
jgi:alkylhydroperoxidase family enzyme